MSITYSVIPGDTFAAISRKNYGTESHSGLIISANPGFQEPLTPGTVLTIPDQPDLAVDKIPSAPSLNDDEVSITIGGNRFRFWESVSITRSIDSQDIVEFSALFEPDSPQFRETFRPFRFQDMIISVGGEPLFRGTIVGINPSTSPNKRSVTVSGYALPGVLADCTPPGSALPLEFIGQDIQAIATRLVAPFGLSIEMLAGSGSIFEKVAIDPGRKILDFLSDLARQRNLVISSNPLGALRILRSITRGVPVAILSEGESPLLSASVGFNPQEFYSAITGISPSEKGSAGVQHTEQNPHLLGVVRPLTFEARDAVKGALPATVQAKIGRMYGNSANYKVKVNTWRNQIGDLWEPNTLIQLTAPGAMVYQKTLFLIRTVRMEQTSNSKISELDLVLPGSFSGEIPEVLPWDG